MHTPEDSVTGPDVADVDLGMDLDSGVVDTARPRQVITREAAADLLGLVEPSVLEYLDSVNTHTFGANSNAAIRTRSAESGTIPLYD